MVDGIVLTNPQVSLLDTFEMTYEQWQGGKIGPTEIGHFLIVPPWSARVSVTGRDKIILDPGVVFGNGAHPTTQDCLEAISIVCAGQKVHTMLDLGTGTGILALAAVKRGCKRALAVDFNYLAAQTARANVHHNTMADSICVVQGRAEDFASVPSDLLVANIHYDVMRHIIQNPGFLKQKWFLLSGLMRSQAKEISTLRASLPVLVLKKWDADGVWTTILGITRTD